MLSELFYLIKRKIMVLNLSHPEKNSNKFGMVDFGFSRKVNFLISLLARSRLKFTPFDYEQSLNQEYSVTLDEWRDWLLATLAKSDPRWYLGVDDIESEVEKEISFNQMLPRDLIKNLDWSAIRQLFIKRMTWLNDQYKKVAQEYSTTDMNQIEEAWMQDERISQDWDVSLRTIRPNSNIEKLMNAPTNYPSGEIDSIYKIYYVNYPIFVKCSIGINTIIGVPGEPGFNIQSVIDEIERLVKE